MLLWSQNNNKKIKSLFYLSIIIFLFLTQIPSIDVDNKIEGVDKIVHFTSFLSLTILGFFSYLKKRLSIVIFLVIYGIAIEFLQEALPFNRAFEIKDIIANSLGICSGAIIFNFFVLKNS